MSTTAPPPQCLKIHVRDARESVDMPMSSVWNETNGAHTQNLET